MRVNSGGTPAFAHKLCQHLLRLVIGLLLLQNNILFAGEGLIQWQQANIQLLRGWDYKVGPQQRTIITTESANQWCYGDVFIFIDWTRFDGGRTTQYGEASLRFGFSKMIGKSYSYGIVKDLLISTTFERGKNNVRAYIYGIGVDLDLPEFTYFKTNLYLRDNPRLADDLAGVCAGYVRYFFRLVSSENRSGCRLLTKFHVPYRVAKKECRVLCQCTNCGSAAYGTALGAGSGYG